VKHLLVLIILGAIAWFGYSKYKAMGDQEKTAVAPTPASATQASLAIPSSTMQFNCDGRTRCSQMRSCEEATYFVRHCPNTEMDGNHDGVPCERQWCK
jgi:hypothetical protein